MLKKYFKLIFIYFRWIYKVIKIYGNGKKLDKDG